MGSFVERTITLRKAKPWKGFLKQTTHLNPVRITVKVRDDEPDFSLRTKNKNSATKEEAEKRFVKLVQNIMLDAANTKRESLIADFKWNLIWQLRYDGLLDMLKSAGDLTLRDLADFAYHWDFKIDFHLEPVEDPQIHFTATGMEKSNEL